MRSYLINLARRPDRLAEMLRQTPDAVRVEAVDAQTATPGSLDHWFAGRGPLGEIPRGDKACFLSHRAAWEMFLESGARHAVILEDDVRLDPAGTALLSDDGWVPDGIDVVKLEHYGPPGQRVLVTDIRPLKNGFGGSDVRLGRMLSRHTGAAAYLLSRRAAELLLAELRFDLPVDHLLFNPNNSPLFARLSPWQLLPAIARQQASTGTRSDIEASRRPLRRLGWTYVRRELVRFGYDLRLVPRQLAQLAGGAKFVTVRAAPHYGTDRPMP